MKEITFDNLIDSNPNSDRYGKTLKIQVYDDYQVPEDFELNYKYNMRLLTRPSKRDLEDICMRIYYARIAMNSDAVSRGLDEIDSWVRGQNENFN